MSDVNQRRQAVYAEVLKTFSDYVQEYNAQILGVPDRLRFKAQAILAAETDVAMQAAAKKARDSALTFYLSAWAQKRIPGKITEQNVDQKAKKAESLADHLDSLGQHDQAERQRERAQKLRDLVRD